MKVNENTVAGPADRGATTSNGSAGHEPASRAGEGTASSTGAAGDAQSAATGSKHTEAMIEAALEIVGSGHRLIEVYSDRMRLALRQKFTHAAIALLAAATAIVWLGAASLATLRGICGGFTFLFDGSVWQGDLVGGLVALSLTVLAVVIYQRSYSRRELDRLKAKYARNRNEHSKT